MITGLFHRSIHHVVLPASRGTLKNRLLALVVSQPKQLIWQCFSAVQVMNPRHHYIL